MLEVRALTLDFDPAGGSWTGTAKLKLPGPPPQVIADATVVVREGSFERASLVAGNSLGTYGFGVRLERLALDVRANPFRFGGELALGAGPSLPGLGQLVRVSGAVDFTAGTPSELRVRGRSQVGPATGTASYTASSTGRQDFAGDAAIELRPDIGVSATVKGVIQPSWFVFQGGARARMLGLSLQGDGLFSSVGLAACVPVQQNTVKTNQGFRVGFGYRYATKRLDLMSGSCDVAPWSPVALGGKAGAARAAQAGAVATFDVKAGLPGLVLEVSGADAPPNVTLTGPAGAARSARPARRRPRAPPTSPWPRHVRGAGRLTLEPGSSAVTAVRRGDGLPAPSVKARVSGRGHRAHPALDRAGAARPGRALRGGGPRRGRADRHDRQGPRQQALPRRRTARRAGGRSWPSSSRRAWSRERIVAGRYTAPAPQRPARPKGLALRRARRGA